MLILLCVFFTAFAHPFENNLFGHQIELRILDDKVVSVYDLELPTKRLQADFASIQKDDIEAQKTQFIQEVYQEIDWNLQVEMNQLLQKPVSVAHQEVATRNKGKFMVFSTELTYQLPPDLESLSLLNQNRMTDPAIFKNALMISSKWSVADTDMIIWKNGRPHTSLMKEWLMKEELRECRISFYPHTRWRELQKIWMNAIEGEPTTIALWTHIKRADANWFSDWKQGRTSLASFCTLLICCLVFSSVKMPARKWEIFGSISLALIFSLLSFSWAASIQITYLFLLVLVLMAIFRQEMAFFFWFWVILSLWVFPKYLLIILGIPIFVFAQKGRKIEPYFCAILSFVGIAFLYYYTKK